MGRRGAVVTANIYSWFADQLVQCVFFRRRPHRHGSVFSKAVAIVSIAVRARIYCAESRLDLEVVPGAINFVAVYALLGLRVTLCVGSSRLGMLNYKSWHRRPRKTRHV